MEWIYNDGGRSKYFPTKANDCACRAIAIATNKDYMEIYDLINSYVAKEPEEIGSARNGVPRDIVDKVLTDLGFKWKPTMMFGQGCTTHLKPDELPKGTIIARLSKHLTCVKNGVIYDTYNPSRQGKRCVYGYYLKKSKGGK